MAGMLQPDALEQAEIGRNYMVLGGRNSNNTAGWQSTHRRNLMAADRQVCMP